MKPTDEVMGFVTRCSGIVASWSAEHFSYQMWDECKARMESPIEQYLFVALSTLAQLCYISTVSITPQHQIGKFRADFLVSFTKQNGAVSSVVVECDSQQFHERTEPERRYEKARDRALLIAGYHTFHFTGKEIKDSPFRVAAEVLAYVTPLSPDELLATVTNFEEAEQTKHAQSNY